MKNLSSYNQDLSVPRKKDVDAKQDKITVNGIVQGDGSGNLSAAETINADLLDLNAASVGLGNVDNVKQYSASNPPPYPVTSVNGKTGNVTVDNITLGVSGAAVGQIAKITAVDADGKPTAWSPVDLPTGGGGADIWEIIADYTATEVASWITINKDTKGNSFSLKKVDVELLLPSTVSGGSWYLYLSPSTEFFGQFTIASQGSTPCRIRCTASSDDIVTIGLKRDKDYSSGTIGLDRKDSYKAITAVRLGNWSDLTFPAGARMLVKGVRI